MHMRKLEICHLDCVTMQMVFIWLRKISVCGQCVWSLSVASVCVVTECGQCVWSVCVVTECGQLVDLLDYLSLVCAYPLVCVLFQPHPYFLHTFL